MADPDLNLHMLPPMPGGWRPPLRDVARFGEATANNIPIVIALILSFIIFLLFLWFFLSPLFSRNESRTPHKPLDVEDAYFVDENIRTLPPHIYGPWNDSFDTLKEQKSATLTLSVTSPPPAYSSCPNSPNGMDGTLPVSTKFSPGRSNDSPRKYLQRQRSFRHLLGGVQHMLARSVSAPLPISKPIPHPEFLLPSPDVSPKTAEDTSTKASSEETTALRPCNAAPHSVSANTLHPPAIYLPSPSQAVVQNLRDSLSRSSSESRFLSFQRFSAGFGQRTATSEQDVSVTSSNIGIAF